MNGALPDVDVNVEEFMTTRRLAQDRRTRNGKSNRMQLPPPCRDWRLRRRPRRAVDRNGPVLPALRIAEPRNWAQAHGWGYFFCPTVNYFAGAGHYVGRCAYSLSDRMALQGSGAMTARSKRLPLLFNAVIAAPACEPVSLSPCDVKLDRQREVHEAIGVAPPANDPGPETTDSVGHWKGEAHDE